MASRIIKPENHTFDPRLHVGPPRCFWSHEFVTSVTLNRAIIV